MQALGQPSEMLHLLHFPKGNPFKINHLASKLFPLSPASQVGTNIALLKMVTLCLKTGGK